MIKVLFGWCEDDEELFWKYVDLGGEPPGFYICRLCGAKFRYQVDAEVHFRREHLVVKVLYRVRKSR